jgi:hypothetical protein
MKIAKVIAIHKSGKKDTCNVFYSIHTKLYIIYAYILITKPKWQNEKESDNRPTLDHA